MHDKSSRDDNQVVDMFCFSINIAQAVSEVLAGYILQIVIWIQG